MSNGKLIRQEFVDDLNAELDALASGIGQVQEEVATLEARVSASVQVTVKDFGAVGDGVTNDAAAINHAITTLSNEGGGVLHFDGSTYAIASAIYMKKNVTLLGIPNKTVILATANTFDVFTYSENVSNTEVNGFIISSANGKNAEARNSGFYYGRFELMHNNIRNVTIDNFYNGIDARFFWKASLVENVQFKRCRTSINVEQTYSGDVSSMTFINLFSENPDYRHLSLDYVESFTFIGCRFQGDGTEGYSFDAQNCYMSFQNCRFDGMDSTTSNEAIFIQNGGVVTFDNCYVIDHKTTGTNTALYSVANGGRMNVNGCAYEISSGFNYHFRVDATSKLTYKSCAKMSQQPPHQVEDGGILLNVDALLESLL